MHKKSTPTARQPKGLPVGGQFATKSLGEADVILAEAHSAARRAVEKAFEAGVAEGERRSRGEPHRDLAEVMDLTGFTFEDALVDIEHDPTVLDDLGGDFTGLDMTDPWAITEHTPVTPTAQAPGVGAVTCFDCDGSGHRDIRHGARVARSGCPTCNGAKTLPATQPGLGVVDVPGRGIFHRRRGTVRADYPSAMRFEANRDLTDDEVSTIAQLVGYRYASTVAGEPLGWPDRDSARSFIVAADSTKTRRDDVGLAFADFEDDLDTFLVDGSPVRKTNQSGPGTKGTRLVDGLGDPDLKVEIYYDSVTG